MMDTQIKIKEHVDNNIKVLVVDDEPKIITVLKRLLKREALEIEYYLDPFEALDAVQNKEFSLVISDNMMPGMSGLELLSEVQKISPHCGRILLTGATKSDQVIDAFNEGSIHRFISKPWDNEKLTGYIHEALDRFRQDKLKQITESLKSKAIKNQNKRYEETRNELKQAQTQIFLHQDQRSSGELWLPDKIRNLSYMVVAEHEGIRQTLLQTLKKAGVSYCVEAENGIKALEYLTAISSVNVIISDWNMEVMDGLTFFRIVKEKVNLAPQPLLLLTATQEKKKEIEFALSAKIDGYIIKPYNMKTLVAQIEYILNKRVLK
jgi:response regulator RpfG family c-di-GMP phosphodiesterase